MVYTSYIGNKDLKLKLNVVIISNIGVNIPQWKKDKTLAPIWSDVQDLKYNKISWAEFRDRYYQKVLSKLNPLDIKAKYDGKILCCCEKDATTCHRSFLVEWLNANGVNAKEYERGDN